MSPRQHLCSRRDCLRPGTAATLAAWAGASPSWAGQGAPESGSSGFETLDLDWTDPRRQRAVPVRLYLPQAERPGAAAPTSGPAPLVVFSHGIGGSRLGYSQRHWDGCAPGPGHSCSEAVHRAPPRAGTPMSGSPCPGTSRRSPAPGSANPGAPRQTPRAADGPAVHAESPSPQRVSPSSHCHALGPPASAARPAEPRRPRPDGTARSHRG
jgi:hypothetical protein